jgi:hypothetical protein
MMNAAVASLTGLLSIVAFMVLDASAMHDWV